MREYIVQYERKEADNPKDKCDLCNHAIVGELVRCKDCIHRQTDKCPMYHEEWYTIDEGDGYFSDDWNVYDYTVDDGFCYLGDTKGGVGE